MTSGSQTNRRGVLLAKLSLLTVSYLALSVSLTPSAAQAQSTSSQAGASTLPPVTVTSPAAQRRRSAPSTSRSTTAARGRRTQTARRIEPAAAPKPFAESQDARTGTSGYFANSTSVAT